MTAKPFAAIFDLDGTLVDAFEDIRAAVNAPLRERGLPLCSVDDIRRMVGDGVGKLLERAGHHVPPEHMDEYRREAIAHYRAHPADRATVYPGIIPALQLIRAEGIRTGVLTNKPQAMTEKTLDQLGLTPYFDDVRGEHPEEAPRKPDPRALFEQLERLGTPRAVLVGDGAPDGEVSQRAGVPFLACLWGTRTREQLEVYSPAAWADSPEDLPELIMAMARAG